VCTAMLVLMFFSQVVPIAGMVYFVNYANLRTHYRASQNFPSWCVMRCPASLCPSSHDHNASLIDLNPFVCPYTQELDVGHGCAIHRRAFLRRRGQLRETEGTRLRGPGRGPGKRRREQRGREHRQQHQGGDDKAWRVEGTQTDQGACVFVPRRVLCPLTCGCVCVSVGGRHARRPRCTRWTVRRRRRT
jgi:hypothetical protein